MIKEDFNKYHDMLVKIEKELIATKGDEYIIEDGNVDDQLANAKNISNILKIVNIDINSINIYFVYLFKHLFSIIKYSKDLKKGSENINSRISDARNYLALIGALLKEMKEVKENKEQIKYYTDKKHVSEKYIKEIKSWLDFVKVKNYKINTDLIVDVDGDVDISDKYLDKIPIQFGIVKGNFDCSDNKLISLEGCPKETSCGFYCSDNKLISLDGCPKIVGGYFDCSYNNLESLEGCPKEVRWHFSIKYNSELIYEYLKNYGFNFVKGKVWTDYDDINEKWNKKGEIND